MSNSGEQDAAVIDFPVAGIISTPPTPPTDVKISMTIDTNEEYGIAMALGETELESEINDILAEMDEDGSLQAIKDKYNA